MKPSKFRPLLVLLSAGVLALSIRPANAQPSGDGDDIQQTVARVSYVSGDVSYLRGDDPDNWQSATVNVSYMLPVLGVCLGHQCIAVAYGATVARTAHPRHGRTSLVAHDGRGVFAGAPSPLLATRYHSLAVVAASVPATLDVTATADDGDIMAIRHRSHPVEGVQFHPESVLTEWGYLMLANFLGRPGSALGPAADAAILR